MCPFFAGVDGIQNICLIQADLRSADDASVRTFGRVGGFMATPFSLGPATLMGRPLVAAVPMKQVGFGFSCPRKVSMRTLSA